ncbi:cob(I)yrinic acid a,c-diamide adenosyltransferase [Clostridium sp. D2Q-14]|uniref:cob(I)yrinic acid a,c-diamide adenosyltransferase n=1 Tax=Anaeromonas gelatinilytica TaxID=2683194 RepID=UPI00193C5969|nr:cob(I)yrinic acid a,c-diamide adenosyltransferase [Anaeromonas gelatinilytica]MBS4536327.1 cob(I)yrinic acid a,c-diamide adenosyltransferase [Anaeromonas gelatinilytica]
MRVYTRTGDKGKTSLYDSKRVFKDSARVESYGTIDELNSTLGLAKNFIDDKKMYDLIHNIQRKLFDVAAELATEDKAKLKFQITKEDVKFLENKIDEYLDLIKTPDHFVIPGSGKAAGYMHVSRTICRRAERRIITLAREIDVNEHLLKYINRLSDLIYSLSRYLENEYEEVKFNR